MIRFALAFVLSFTAVSAHAQIDIQEVTSPDGIDAWLVEEGSIPFVALNLIFDGGATLDLPEKRGATNLMMALLEEGAGDLDARTFQEQRESLAATFRFNASDDSVTVSAVFLTENQDEALALLREALINPRFDQDAIDRVRAQVVSGIRSDATSPNSIATATLNELAYGNHPYGSSLDGTEDTVSNLTQQDLFDAHRNALSTARVHVGAAGDISADELGLLIDDLIGNLPDEAPALPDRVEFGLTGGTTVVSFNTPQSVALFGHAGIERDDDDFFAAFILNEVLGGRGLESRLTHEVREKRGLTYGVSTFLVPKDLSEAYLGQVASANDRIGEAITVIRDEWALLASEGLSQEELDGTKTYLTGAYPLRFDGNAEIAGILAGMQAVGLPTDYIANRNDFINAVTLDEVNRVASELLDPENLHFVVVGQPEGLTSSE